MGIADKTWIERPLRRYGRTASTASPHRRHIPELSAERLFPDAWLDYATKIQRPNLPPNHPVHRTRRIAIDLGEGVGRD